MLSVTFVTYSGMEIPLHEEVDRDEAQAVVKRYNAAARKRGQPVAKCEANTWEHQEPDDCGMVGDRHGYLMVRRVRSNRRARRYFR